MSEYTKRAQQGLFVDRNIVMIKKLYDFLDISAPQATGANLDGSGSPVHQSLDRHEIRAEYAFCGYANVLAYAAVLLGLTFSWNTISCNSSFSANLTSTSHSYIHLIQLNSFVWPNTGLSKSRLSLHGQRLTREHNCKAIAITTSTFAKLSDYGVCVKTRSLSFMKNYLADIPIS